MKITRFFVASMFVIMFSASCSNNFTPVPDVFYKITFDSDGGTVVPAQKLKKYETVMRPDDPTKASSPTLNYAFIDWYQVKNNVMADKPFNFDTKIKSDITLKAKWEESTRYYTITFETASCIEKINPQHVEYNQVAKDPGPVSKPSSAFEYDFKEWQLNGQKYEFSHQVKSDLYLTPAWDITRCKYMVYFDTDGGTEIEPCLYEYGESILKPEAPTKSDLIRDYTFYNWYEVKGEEISSQPYEFNQPIENDVYLKAKWQQSTSKTYQITGEDGDHLSFATIDGDPLTEINIEAGKKCEFRVNVASENDCSNGSVAYEVPNSLNVKVGGIPLSEEDYQIEPLYGDKQKAKVIINGESVIGNIEVSGIARITTIGYYSIVTNFYGLAAKDLELHYARTDNRNIFHLTSDTGFASAKKENIFIKVDDATDWMRLSESTDFCEYNERPAEFIIKENVISNCIQILAYPSDYKLDNMSWTQIDEISNFGLADKIFNIGDTKSIKLLENSKQQTFNHHVRIIDFNHDVDIFDKPIGITFEFADLITKEDGKPLYIRIKNKNSDTNYDFVHSILNTSLSNLNDDGSIISMIPVDLFIYIKQCHKKVGLGKHYSTKVPYSTFLFPLAYDEIGKDGLRERGIAMPNGEGTRYAYYKDNTKKSRIKNPAITSSCAVANDYDAYWLRTPTIKDCDTTFDTGTIAVEIDDNAGEMYPNWLTNHLCVAPAFCI